MMAGEEATVTMREGREGQLWFESQREERREKREQEMQRESVKSLAMGGKEGAGSEEEMNSRRREVSQLML